MSKTELRKYLKELNETQLRELILEVYSARRDTKEYFDFYLNPDSRKLGEKFRSVIHNEFVSRQGYLKRKPRRSVCQRAIADFRSFSPDPEVVGELMLEYISLADRWMRYYRHKPTIAFAESIAHYLISTIDYIFKNGLWHKFKHLVSPLIENADRWSPFGYKEEIEAAMRETAVLDAYQNLDFTQNDADIRESEI